MATKTDKATDGKAQHSATQHNAAVQTISACRAGKHMQNVGACSPCMVTHI